MTGTGAADGSGRGHKRGSGLKYAATLALAATADGLQIAFPPFWIPISIVTVLILFCLWGWRWEILVVLVPELAPIIGILPTWTAVAIYLTRRDYIMAEKAEEMDPPTEMRDVGPGSRGAKR